MVCRKCGSEMEAADRFCPKCGVAANGGGPSQKVQYGAQVHANPVSFGALQDRWWAEFPGIGSLPRRLSVALRAQHAVICRSHLVLVQGDEKRSAAMDVIRAMGLMGGVVGAMRGLKDSFLNKKSRSWSLRVRAQRLTSPRWPLTSRPARIRSELVST